MIEISDYTFSLHKDNQPAAICKNGDTIVFITRDCYNNTITEDSDEAVEIDVLNDNPSTGPLFVEGAEKGDVLSVEILDIEVNEYGVVSATKDQGPLGKFIENRNRIIQIRDNKASYKGLSWDINPMIGVIGLPNENDKTPTFNVFEGGANMDSAIITRGTKVYLPVRCKGGLLSIGDLHASMGDGEVCGTGIEIAGRVTVKVSVIKNFELNWPVTETDDAYYVNTSGETTDEAIQRGYEEMHRLIMNAYNLDSTDSALYMTMQGYIGANQACLTPRGGGNSFRIGTPKLKDKKII